MDEATYEAIRRSLALSVKRYPNCKVANCDCNEKAGEWTPGCNCLGHFFQMDEAFGEGRENWSLDDFAASARVGRPLKTTGANAT